MSGGENNEAPLKTASQRGLGLPPLAWAPRKLCISYNETPGKYRRPHMNPSA